MASLFYFTKQGVIQMAFKHYKKNDLFYCYSINLFHYLKANGFYYLFKERNPKNEDLFYWTFERTSELLEAVTFYSNNK
jgi:hypothetical protein